MPKFDLTRFVGSKAVQDARQALAERAKQKGTSVEVELFALLGGTSAGGGRPAGGLGSKIAGRFATIGLDGPIIEQRGEAARPADLTDNPDNHECARPKKRRPPAAGRGRRP